MASVPHLHPSTGEEGYASFICRRCAFSPLAQLSQTSATHLFPTCVGAAHCWSNPLRTSGGCSNKEPFFAYTSRDERLTSVNRQMDEQPFSPSTHAQLLHGCHRHVAGLDILHGSSSSRIASSIGLHDFSSHTLP